MRRTRKKSVMRAFKSHRHKVRVGRMKGLTSIPLRYRGRRY